MFKTTLFITVLIFMFTSCSEKNDVLKNFKNYENPKAIQFTKKRDILHDGQIQGSFFITYLNKIDKSFNEDNYENFLVGVFLSNKKSHDLINSGYTLLLDGNISEKIIEIPNDSNIVKSIPLRNSWANYYLIKYNSVEKNRLKLAIKNPTFENLELTFNKSN